MRWIWISGVSILFGLVLWWFGRGWMADRWSAVADRSRQTTEQFLVIGDTHGVNPIYQQMVSEVRDRPYRFLLHLADASEDGTAEEFSAVRMLEAQLHFPVYHTVGNHDIASDPTRRLFTTAFQQAAWGSWTIGSVRLIILDNADRKVGFSSDQLDWLETELAKPHAGPTILAYHRPFDLPLADVLGDDETAASRATNQRLVAILQTHPVDYIFTGHLHTYLEYTVAGIPAVVSGGGGDPAQAVLGGPKNNLFHYLIVTVTGQNLQVDVRHIQLTE